MSNDKQGHCYINHLIETVMYVSTQTHTTLFIILFIYSIKHGLLTVV